MYKPRRGGYIGTLRVSAPQAKRGDFVVVGLIKGFALFDADPDGDTVLEIAGEFVTDVEASGEDVVEGTPLYYNSETKMFTNSGTGAYHAVAGYGAKVATGSRAEVSVYLGLF